MRLPYQIWSTRPPSRGHQPKLCCGSHLLYVHAHRGRQAENSVIVDLHIPPDAEAFRELIAKAVAEWCGGGTLHARVLTGGRSGACVLRADISGIVSGDLAPGQYILKLKACEAGEPRSSARAAHELAVRASKEFSADHVPNFLAESELEVDSAWQEATLLGVAGGSLHRFVPAVRPDSPALLDQVSRVVKDIYQGFMDPNRVETLTLREALRAWMGDVRFEDALKVSHDLAAGATSSLTAAGPAIWPHHFFEIQSSVDVEPNLFVYGFNHRDLHGGNVLFEVEQFDKKPGSNYYIIDFDEAQDGPFCFDIGYLEAERFIKTCDGVALEDAAALLATDTTAPQAEALPAGTLPFSQLRDQLRAGELAAIRLTTREDSLARQALAARIAAGLTWLRRRSLTASQRATAHLYTAVHAGRYAAILLPDLLNRITLTPTTSAQIPLAEPHGSEELEACKAIVEQLDDLGGSSAKLILVTERQPASPAVASLGLLPWTAVIDLDPKSAEDGVFRDVEPNLQASRGIHRFSLDLPDALLARATAWMFANGWTQMRQGVPDDREWAYSTVPVVRTLGRQVKELAGDQRIVVVVLGGERASAGSGAGIDRAQRVIDALDEVFEGSAEFFCVGGTIASPLVHATVVDASSAAFLQVLAARVGTRALHSALEVPGGNGWVEIPRSVAAPMLESFEILHRHLVSTEDLGDRTDSFWRGRLPSWADLYEGADVERDLHRRLVSQVRAALDHHRTRTVVLNHNPGSGGSTMARRVAWDLRSTAPVCVLRGDTPISPNQVGVLAERLRQLFTITERPVLCIAEPSVLSETAREQLYRTLVSTGSRVVLLYVRRTFRSAARTPESGLDLLDPMSLDEYERFTATYRALTDDASRQAELAKYGRPEFTRYRSPFFFGLTVFDRDFERIEDYVSAHLVGLRGRARDVLEYLAFVTVYSDGGIELSTVRKLLDLGPDGSHLGPEDLFGEAASRLLVRHGSRIRLMHPVLADEALAELYGGGRAEWRRHSHELAVGLIRDLGTMTDPDSLATRSLLRQIFVDRPGTRFDEVDDRLAFSPLIEELDDVDYALGHRILKALTEHFPNEAHFWTHLGRHQIYRLNRDLRDAEGYLNRAISLAAEDPVHHHVLGQVRRFMMKQVISQNRDLSSGDLLERIGEHYSGSVEAFTQSRHLAPDNIYGYITHIQTTIEAAKALRDADDVEVVTDLSDEVAEWVRRELAVAHELADAASMLYGALDDKDDFLKRCLSDIRRLYGDLDRVIEIWELASYSPTGSTPYGRRSLAHAYFTRSGRRWSSLSDAELARIEDLMATNLRSPRPSEEDFRLWFEAAHLLPRFDMDEAISNLALWSDRVESWRANYYAYVLYFVLWFTGRIPDTEEFRICLENCQRLAVGRSRHSLLWLADGPESCPLIGAEELGEWDRDRNFWATSAGLKRINGVIDEYIRGPQAGRIVVDAGVRVFFVPAVGGFSKNADEGREVNFLLGFSPDGPRAWDVRRGHVENGNRTRVGDPHGIKWALRRVNSGSRPATAESIRAGRLVGFIETLVEARHAAGLETPLLLIDHRMRAVFGDEVTSNPAGMGDLTSVIRRLDNLVLVGRPAAAIVSLRDVPLESSSDSADPVPALGVVASSDADRKLLELEIGGKRTKVPGVERADTFGVGTAVTFMTSASGAIRGSSVTTIPAGAVVVDGRVVDEADLPFVLAGMAQERLDVAGSMGESSVSSQSMYATLRGSFLGPGTLEDALGASDRRDALRAVPGLAVSGGRVFRSRSGDLPGGKTDAPPGAQGSAGKKGRRSKAVNPDVVLGTVRRLQDTSPGEGVDPGVVGKALQNELGDDRYSAWIGQESLTTRLGAVRGVTVERSDDGRLVVRAVKKRKWTRKRQHGRKK